MKKPYSRRRRRHGFTLLEVLLVLAILVIMASLVTVSIIAVQKGSYTDIAKTEISAIRSEILRYHINLATYPSSLDDLRTPPSNLKNPKKWVGPYLEKDPVDPWGNPYGYELNSGDQLGDQFRIWSFGPDGQEGGGDDISSNDPTT